MKSVLKTAALLSSLCALPAASATLTAQSTGPFPGFSIEFNDLNLDGHFEITELVSFSGFTITGFGAKTLTRILAVPDIFGIALKSELAGVIPLAPGQWAFDAEGSEDGFMDLSSGQENWTYRITGTSPVPLPGSLPLLAGGIALLLLGRRRS